MTAICVDPIRQPPDLDTNDASDTIQNVLTENWSYAPDLLQPNQISQAFPSVPAIARLQVINACKALLHKAAHIYYPSTEGPAIITTST
jgi:hypothetical protein